MTVKQLKEALEKYPENMQFFIDGGKSGFRYGLANSVRKQKINLKEDPDGEVLATESVVIIDEE